MTVKAHGDVAESKDLMALARYSHDQYCTLNGQTGEAGGNHLLRNIDCKIQQGGAIQEVLDAKDSID